MLRERSRFLAIAAVGLLVIAGCTSITAGPSESPSAAGASSEASAAVPTAATAAPSVDVSGAPSTLPSPAASTLKPPKTPKPPKSATPSQPTGPAMANLIVTKFLTDVERIIAGQRTSGRVTVKNVGTADAGPFDVGVGYSNDDGLGFGGYSPTPVDGLGAGESVQVTVNISLDSAAAVTFTATADSNEVITESNEDDNANTLSITAVSLPNIAWQTDGFSVDEYPGDISGYETNIRVVNSGTADVPHNFKVSFAWSSDDVSGTFPDMSCCALYGGVALTPGQQQKAGQGVYQFPTSGHYTVVATLDPDNQIEESNETDNTATFAIDILQ